MDDDDSHLALSRTSSISTNATAPNLVGPGRTIGLLFDWLGKGLEAKLNKRATQLNLGPEAAARDIRRIRRYKETSACIRFFAPYAHLTKAQEKKVRKLCKNLLKYARSNVQSTQLRALEEITSLTIEDRLVREILSGSNIWTLLPKYRETNLSVRIKRVIYSVEERETHELWSSLLCRSSRNFDSLLSFQENEVSLLVALKNTLSNPSSSFLAARRLSRDGIRGMRNPYYYFLWECYAKLSMESPNIIEWSNFNRCGFFIMHISRNPLDIVKRLIERFTIPWKFFITAFELREVFFNTNNADEDGEPFTFNTITHYDEKRSDLKCVNSIIIPSLHSVTLDSRILQALYGSENYQDHLSFIRAQDESTRARLKCVSLGEERNIVFAHVARVIEKGEGFLRFKCKCFDLGPAPTGTWNCRDLNCTVHAITILIRYSKTGELKDCARANFFLSAMFSTSRYCKLALCKFLQSLIIISKTTFRCALEFNPTYFGRCAGHMIGCFWRIGTKGGYYFFNTGMSEMASELQLNFDNALLRCCTGDIDEVHAMRVGFYMLMLLPQLETNLPFNTAGHFPIIAFRDAGSNTPSYLAVVLPENHLFWIYATVREGDSFATYLDVRGDKRVTQKFRVVVLRYDPVDFPYSNEWDKFRHREGALDPTGPLFWLQYYPKKDPDFFEDVEEKMPRKMQKIFASLTGRSNLNSTNCKKNRNEVEMEDSDDDQFENVEFSDEENDYDDGTESKYKTDTNRDGDPIASIDDIIAYINTDELLTEAYRDSPERFREDMEAPEVNEENSEANIGANEAEATSSISETFETEDHLIAREDNTEENFADEPGGLPGGKRALEMEKRALEIEHRMLEIEKRQLEIEKRDLEIERMLVESGERKDQGD